MKTILTILTSVIIAITPVFGQKSLLAIPDSLPIGKIQVLANLADAKTVTVECSAPGMETFYKEVSIPSNFQSIEEISEAIETVQVTITPTDPSAEIMLHAQIKNAIGDVQFEAWQGFILEKVYGEDGVISYQVPTWVGDLYFTLVNSRVYFAGAQTAYFVGGNDEFQLDIAEDGFISLGNFGNGFLKIVTSSGIYFYDLNTGKKASSPSSGFVVNSQFDDIQLVEDVGYVSRTLCPEWNYVPWLQVTAPENGVITLDVLSANGFTPTGVWVRSLEQFRTGEALAPMQYTPGMTITVKPGQTVYVWFDFSDWVWGMGVYEDGGGKG